MPDDSMRQDNDQNGTPAEEQASASSEYSASPSASDVRPFADLEDSPWLRSLWRPLLITVSAGCLVVAYLAFIRRILPEMPASYTQVLTAIGLVTASIGCASTTWLAQPEQRSSRQAGYRAAEFIFILLLTRISVWAITNSWPGFELILRPLESLLDGYFIIGLIAVLIAWVMASSMTNDMINMSLRPDDLYMTQSFGGKWHDTARPVYTDRGAILRRFTGRWVLGGLLLVVFAAGSRFAMPEPGYYIPIIGQNIDRAVIIAVIVYFLAGLALISQGQLALLRARWTLQKTPSAPNVLRNWPIYAFTLILVIGLIAALLPLGGTFHLAMILRAIINGAFWIIMQVFGTILGLLMLLASLFQGEQQEEVAPTPEPLPQITPPPPPQEPPIEIPPWAGGTVFWIVAAILIGYAAYIYFSGRGVSFAWLKQLWLMVRIRFGQMLDAYQDWQATHLRSVEDTDGAGAGKRRRRLLSWLGYRGLDPTAQARYYYLSLLEQAEEAGHPRRQSETPYRYAPRLAGRLAHSVAPRDAGVGGEDEGTESGLDADDAQVAEAIDELTGAFVRIRYAADRIDAERAKRIRTQWERLKRSLRSQKSSRDDLENLP